MSHKSIFILIVLLAVVAAAAGCVPAAAPVVAPAPPAAAPAATQPPATAVPAVEMTPTPVDPAKPVDYGPYGQVVWNDAPVPGARVKLAKQGACRDAGSDGVLASTVADANGKFAFPSVPDVEWDICYAWPEGQDNDVFMIGERKPVMPVEDLTLKLTKTLHLQAPDLTKPLEAPLEVRWEPISEATTYRVVISDMGTSELLVQQDVTGTSVTVTQPLKPGHGYGLSVSGMNAKGEQIAFFSGEFKAAGTAVAPEDESVQSIQGSCYREGLLTYVDRDTGICFAYPQGFAFAGANGSYAAGSQVQAELRGPTIGAGPDPLFASLTLDFQPYNGVDLGPFVDEMIKRDVPADLVSKLQRKQATWGGRAAEIIEPWPGRLSSRVVVVDAAPGGYNILRFWPALGNTPAGQLSKEAAQAQKDMDALYEIVSESFAKLPPPGVPLPADSRLDLPKSCLVNGQPLFIDSNEGYCFVLTQEMTAKREADGSVAFYGPALDPSPDPLRVALAVTAEEAAKDATLDKMADAYVASFKELAAKIGRQPITIGGEPAVRLDGVPGRPTAVEILMLHDGKLYHVRFTPDMSFAKSKDEATRLIQAVTSSFGFLPGATQPAGQPPAAAGLVPVKPYRGVSFSVPKEVAGPANGATVLAQEETGGPWWAVSPQHVEFVFGSYAQPKSNQTPRVAIYVASEFAALSPHAADQIAALQRLLQAKPANPEGQLPFLPLVNAVQQIHARVKYLPFKGGEGVSYLTQYAQGPVPINNGELFYTFQGLTTDGKYYVSAILPVSHASLPATAGEFPAARLEAAVANWPGYLNDVSNGLSSASDAGFKPALSDLDALVQSIEVKPDALTPQTAIQVELKRIADVDPNYTVQQVPALPPADDLNLYDTHPPMALVTFPGYAGGQPSSLPYSFNEPAVQVYRVADFQGFGPSDQPLSYQGQYEALKKVLSDHATLAACSGVTLKPGQNMAYPVTPFLPPLNASQTFCTQPAYVDFPGGKGIRYITAFSQSAAMLTDQSVFYTFQGLTDDGKYYISAVLPVSTGVLPANPGEGFDPKTWTTTLKGWVDKLAALDSKGFHPSLEALDALAGSIAVR